MGHNVRETCAEEARCISEWCPESSSAAGPKAKVAIEKCHSSQPIPTCSSTHSITSTAAVLLSSVLPGA